MKSIIAGVLGFLLVTMLFFSCERIDAGHVGVKVNAFGSQKGIDGITEVTGVVLFNPFTTKIYEFPTYIQHKQYDGDNSFTVNSKDGSEFHVSPIINYQVNATRVPFIFGKYRRSLDEIEDGFLKVAVYDAFRIATNGYTADSLISNREVYEHKVRSILDKQLLSEGFIIQQFTSNLDYPATFKTSIEAKNNSVQKALQAENEVKTAEAQAKISIAQAEGKAQSVLINAKAEAESNRLRQQTLTSMLLQQMYIDKWDGKLPVYGQVPQMFKSVQ